MQPDRRTRIADAIIETLARAGSRGLTHRAVDAAAGLPEGSTSYYFRTRNSLVDAAVARLAEVDSEALQTGEEGITEVLAGVVDDRRLAGRDRTLARFELSLEAIRRPELRHALDGGSERVRQVIADHLAEEDVPDPEATAGDVMALVDGLLFRELTAAPGHHRDLAGIRRAIERMI